MRLKSLLILILSLCALPVYAQFRAGIEGTVTDSTGAVVKGAKITVTSQETGASQEATSNDNGFYSVSHLAPGLYTVNASLAGFEAKGVNDVLLQAQET